MPDLSSVVASQGAVWSGASAVVSGLSPVVVWTGGLVLAGIVLGFLSGLGGKGASAKRSVSAGRGGAGSRSGGMGFFAQNFGSGGRGLGKPKLAVPGKYSARLRETYLRMRDGNLGQRRPDITRAELISNAVTRDERNGGLVGTARRRSEGGPTSAWNKERGYDGSGKARKREG